MRDIFVFMEFEVFMKKVLVMVILKRNKKNRLGIDENIVWKIYLDNIK